MKCENLHSTIFILIPKETAERYIKQANLHSTIFILIHCKEM